MKRKILTIISILLVIAMQVTLFAGCNDDKPTETPIPVPSVTLSNPILDNSNENDISNAAFSAATIKQGDKVSNFTVKAVDMREADNGDVLSCKVEFEGELTVYGTYEILVSQDDQISSCKFYYTDDVAPYIPAASEFTSSNKFLVLDAQEMIKLYEKDSGTAAIVIDSYTYSYEDATGVVQSAEVVGKAQSDYVIVG